MPKLTKYCLTLFAILTGLFARAQEFSFINLNHRIALPSLECYNILQDDLGTMWIGTEQGLLRYNGSSTKVFDHQNGLPEKAVYAALSYRGKLWFATSKNRILNYGNGKLYETAASKSYQRRLGKPYAQNFTYALSAQQNKIYLVGGRSLYYMDTDGSKLQQLIAPKDNAIYLKQTTEGLLPINTGAEHFYDASEKRVFSVPLRLNINGPGGYRTFRPDMRRHMNGAEWRILTAQTKKFIFLTYHHKIIKFDRALRTFELIDLRAPIISLYSDADDGLWVGTVRQGLHYFDFTERNNVPVVSLRNSSVSGIVQDREGNIWCTTLEDGVFMLRNKQVVGYQNLSGQSVAPTMLQTMGNKLWISTPGFGLQYYDATANRFVPVDKTSGHSYYHIWERDKKTYLTSETGVLRYHADGSRSTVEKYGSQASMIVLGSTSSPSGDFYTITYDRIFRTNVSTGKRSTMVKLRAMGRTIQYAGEDTLFYGCADGLYLYDIKRAKNTKMPGIYNDVPSILQASDGKIWVGTVGNGLFTYYRGRLQRIKLPSKVQTNTFNRLTTDGYGNIWTGTNAGLVKIGEQHGKLNVEIYDTDNGLPSNKIYRVAAVGDKLFFTTFTGLFSVPLTVLAKERTPPLLSLSSISYGGKSMAGRIRLPYENNRLDMEFNIGQYGNDDYRIGYTLHPGQSVSYVKGNTISLQHLSSGDYQFRAFAVNGDGLRSRQTVTFNFTVLQPFWLKWWFLSGVVVLVGLLIWLIKDRQIKRIGKRQAELHRINSLIADSKLTALQARMNPHFIFNAINSIQNYIHKNRNDDAHDYLTKFSRLIRLILQQSAERFITLDRELEALKLYIELEQLRFRSAFTYRLELTEDLDLHNVYVPTMLIQPYVENAIWHGLMNLDGQRRGELGICIDKREQQLCILISDNGIGRAKAAELSNSRHYISAGMMLTEDRLRMLREMFADLSFQVKVTDLYDADGRASGTAVEILLSLTTPQMID